MIGRYRNKLDGSILEIVQVVERREKKLKAIWIESQTKQGLEFFINDNFNKFQTFEKL